MQRYEERREDLKNAYERLKEGLAIEKPDDLHLDGILQRFEFTFELAWKTVKDYLTYQGFTEKTGSPREIIQLGYQQGIIEDGEAWIKMMLARNSLSHLYDEETSREIYQAIKQNYIVLLDKLLKKLN